MGLLRTARLTERPARSEADRAVIAQRIVDGASLEAVISAVKPDASVLGLFGLKC